MVSDSSIKNNTYQTEARTEYPTHTLGIIKKVSYALSVSLVHLLVFKFWQTDKQSWYISYLNFDFFVNVLSIVLCAYSLLCFICCKCPFTYLAHFSYYVHLSFSQTSSMIRKYALYYTCCKYFSSICRLYWVYGFENVSVLYLCIYLWTSDFIACAF